MSAPVKAAARLAAVCHPLFPARLPLPWTRIRSEAGLECAPFISRRRQSMPARSPEPQPDPNGPPTPRKSRLLLRIILISSALAGLQAYLSPPSTSKALRLDGWLSLRVSSVERLPDGETAIITLSLPQQNWPRREKEGILLESVYVKQPELQIQRPYTPLDPIPSSLKPPDTLGAYALRLLVKRYEDGEVSRYLHSMKPGAVVEVRGPETTWSLPKTQDLEELAFIAGGTGITPFVQLINQLMLTASSSTASERLKLTLVQTARTPETLYLRPYLEQLAAQHPDWFSLYSASDTGLPDFVVDKVGRIGIKELREWIGTSQGGAGRQMVLVSGPEPMIKALAGPRSTDGLGQGTAGGVLGELGYTKREIWKL